MKKIFLILFFSIVTSLLSQNFAFCLESGFSRALKNCDKYSLNGAIPYNGEVFNLLITLNKGKNDKCVYKEKIYQDKNYQMLTCNFTKSQLSFMSSSMEKFNSEFKKQIAKNKIFEAKMTSNGEIFNKYLANPQFCTITHSKQ